jgi:hypothetical protein
MIISGLLVFLQFAVPCVVKLFSIYELCSLLGLALSFEVRVDIRWVARYRRKSVGMFDVDHSCSWFIVVCLMASLLLMDQCGSLVAGEMVARQRFMRSSEVNSQPYLQPTSTSRGCMMPVFPDG